MILKNTKDIDITANTESVGAAVDTNPDYSQSNTVATNKVFTNDIKYANGIFFVRTWEAYNNSSEISTDIGVEIQSNEFLHNQNIYKNGEENILSLSNVPAYDPNKVDNHILLRGRPEYNPSKNPNTEQARSNYSFKEIYVKKPWCGVTYVMSDKDAETDDNTKWEGNVNKNYCRSTYHNKIKFGRTE